MKLKVLQSKKNIVISIVLLISIIGIGIIYANSNHLIEDFKEKVISHLEDTTGLEIKVDKIGLRGITGFRVKNVEVRDGIGSHLMKAKEINLHYRIFDILSNSLNPLKSIKRITLIDPDFNIMESDDGWNFDSLIDGMGDGDSDSIDGFSLPIYIEGGRVELSAFDIEESMVDIEGFIIVGRDSSIKLKGKVESISDKDIVLEALIEDGNYGGYLEFDSLSLEDLKRSLSLNFLEELEVDGDAGGKINFRGLGKDLSNYSGVIGFEDTRVNMNGVEVKDINASLGINRYGIRFNNLSAKYEGISIDIAGDIFDWENPQLNLGYSLPKFSLKELSEDLPYHLEGYPKVQGRIRGTISDPNVVTNISLDQAKVGEISFNNLNTTFYYQDRVFNLDDFIFEIGDGRVSGGGTISIEEEFNYIIPIDLDGINLSEIESPISLDEEGIVDGEFILSGNGFDLNNINLLGSLYLRDASIKGYEFDDLHTNLWLNNGKVFLNHTNLSSPYGNFIVDGLVDLDGELNLTVEGNGINLNSIFLNNNIDKVEGLMEFRGDIRGDLSSPKVYSWLDIDELIYDSYSLGEVGGKLFFEGGKLELEGFELPKFTTTIDGPIYLDDGSADIILDTKLMDGEKLLQILELEIPLTGEVGGRANLKRLYPELNIAGEVHMNEGSVYNHNFDGANLQFAYKENEFIIKDSKAYYKDSNIEGRGGFVDGELDIYLSTKGFEISNLKYGLEDIDLKGIIEGEGRLYGPTSNLKVDSKLKSSNMSYNEHTLGNIESRVSYIGSKIHIRELVVDYEYSRYNLRGSIDLEQESIDSLVLSADRLPFSYIDKLIEEKIDLPYNLSGRVIAAGPLTSPDINLDLGMLAQDNREVAGLKGSYKFNDALDLDISTRGLDLSNLDRLEAIPYDLKGLINLTGTISGPIDKLNISSNSRVVDGGIGRLEFDELAGRLDLIDGDKLVVDQNLNIRDENNLFIKGDIPLHKDGDFDLLVDLKRMNLSLLPTFFSEIDFARGRGSVNIEVSGKLDEPQIEGNLEISSGSFYHSILHREVKGLNLKATLVEDKIEFKEGQGMYGEGDFTVEGDISLDGFMPGDYNLIFSGSNLAFEQGFWKGKNDVDVTITDSFRRPLIKGDLLVYDTDLNLSFEWPVQELEGEPFFETKLDLRAIPGKNVRIGNNQIDILIQSGELNLDFDEELQLTGRVESNSGEFSYYNTKFSLDKGVATFRRYDLIPNLQINTSTKVNDTDIYLDVTGNQDPFNLTLTSDPFLTEEEIIMLLTRQGGVGEFLDRDYEGALRSEMWRMIDTGIQNELVSRVEQSFERSLDLDQVRIQSVLSNEVSIELGKFIWENMMLKYTHTFGIEEELSLGFEYSLNRGIKGFDSLRFDGEYDNLGEYHLNLEATIPFR